MFCDVLQRLRRARGLNQTTLAKDLNVSQATIASWENGTRRPDLDMFTKICDYFGVTADEMLDNREIDMTEEEREIWDLREKVRRDPERRYMFSFAKNGNIKDLKRAIALIDALKGVDDEI